MEKRDLVIIYYLVVFQHLSVSFFVVLIVIEVISDVVTIIFQERIRQDQIILFEIVSKSILNSPVFVGIFAAVTDDDPGDFVLLLAKLEIVCIRRRFKIPYLVIHNIIRNW